MITIEITYKNGSILKTQVNKEMLESFIEELKNDSNIRNFKTIERINDKSNW